MSTLLHLLNIDPFAIRSSTSRLAPAVSPSLHRVITCPTEPSRGSETTFGVGQRWQLLSIKSHEIDLLSYLLFVHAIIPFVTGRFLRATFHDFIRIMRLAS